MLRSKQGCWTCRLRRKKCDESRPRCSTCESLLITCHGYGPKPDWMDGGEKEKAVASSIKQIVKHTSRRKDRVTNAATASSLRVVPSITDFGGNGIRIAPKVLPTVETSKAFSDTDSAYAGSSPSRSGVLSDRSSSVAYSEGSTVEPPAESDPLERPTTSGSPPSSETVLLMHFLDNVFPLQYPLYRPGITDGGRGWLGSLLVKTPPLYHACLGLAAYHKKIALLSENKGTQPSEDTAAPEKHLANSLSEFRKAVRNVQRWAKNNVCPINALGLMASNIQLIFFELFSGHDNTWKVHLDAGTSLFSKGYWQKMGISPPTDQFVSLGVKSPQDANDEISTFRFLCGAIVWLDVLSSITAGTAPRLQAIHSDMASRGEVRLEGITGCSTWVVFQLGDISALHEHKILALESGVFDLMDFEVKVDNIRREIQRGIAAESLDSLAISPVTGIAHEKLITHLFALTATIYLHLVVHGFSRERERLIPILHEARTILTTQIPTCLMSVIVCPLYIIGCVADDVDKPFFRTTLTSPPVLDASLKHRNEILLLLEDIWLKRCLAQDWTWQDTLKLPKNSILLL